MQLLIAVEDEPYPRSPIGRSAAIKLQDWLDLAARLEEVVELDVRSISELGNDKPDIVEAFTTREELLDATTFSSREEHLLVNDLRSYWPQVVESGVPCIPVYDEAQTPKSFPVFVRSGVGSFGSGSRLNSMEELEAQRRTHSLVVRPFVEIETCGPRKKITKELRSHVVRSRCACVEFLFPRWAATQPTDKEFAGGCQWTARRSPNN